MQFFLKMIEDVSLSSAVIFIATLVFLFTVFKKTYGSITVFHDKIQERENSLDSIKELLEEVKKSQKEMKESIKELSKREIELEKRQDENDKAMKTRELNKLKDRLIQSYRYYTSLEKNPLQKWSEMESEAFKSLYYDYKSLKGNHYIDETVWPGVQELEIVPMTDADGLSELAKSRKG